MAKAPKFKNWITPVGTAKVTFVNQPSAPYQGKGDPMYKCRILIEDNDENRKWVQGVIDVALEEAKREGIKMKKNYHNPFVFPEDVDEDSFIPEEGKDRPRFDEDHRGKIFFDAKSKFQPGLIDTARNALPEDTKIYGGDTIREKLEAAPFVSGANTGITFRLKTVQLIEKNSSFTGGKRGVDTDGFDNIDGYVAEPSGGEEDVGAEDF